MTDAEVSNLDVNCKECIYNVSRYYSLPTMVYLTTLITQTSFNQKHLLRIWEQFSPLPKLLRNQDKYQSAALQYLTKKTKMSAFILKNSTAHQIHDKDYNHSYDD